MDLMWHSDYKQVIPILFLDYIKSGCINTIENKIDKTCDKELMNFIYKITLIYQLKNYVNLMMLINY